MNFFLDMLNHFQDHYVMWFIFLSLAFAVAITIEKFYLVFVKFNINARAFYNTIENYIKQDDIEGAVRVCAAYRSALLSHVLKFGLLRANLGSTQIQNAVEAALLQVKPMVTKRTHYLGIIANIATLLGLIGTIMGLIDSFRALATVTGEAKQTMLAQGISSALFATSFGLMVAIFCMVVHGIITSQSNKIIADVDQYSSRLIDRLSCRK